MNTPTRCRRGLALLEFALGVAVAAIALALALNAVSRLKVIGDEARRVTVATQQAAASSTRMLHCELRPGRRAVPADCVPCAPDSSSSPRPATAPPARSCP